MADVETKTTETTRRAVRDAEAVKRNRLVFFSLNLGLVVPFLVRNYSFWGLIGALVITLLSFYLLIVEPRKAAPAASAIPLQLFLDVWFCLAVSYQSLIDNFRTSGLERLFKSARSEWAILLVAGFAVSFFVPKLLNVLWLRFIGKTAVGISVIMLLWADGRVYKPTFKSSGEILLAVYLFAALIWFTFCVISCYADPDTYTRNNWLSNFLIVMFVLFCTMENGMAQSVIQQAKRFLLSMPGETLKWWRVIFSVFILIGCAIATSNYLNDAVGADALVLSFMASACLILRVLIDNEFSFNWVIFVVFLISSVKCFKNEMRRKKTLRLPTAAYAAVQFAAALISIWLLKAGLWVNLIIVATYTLIFYATTGKKSADTHRVRHWLTVLSAPAAFAIAYIWHVRFSLDMIVLIATVYAVLGGTMVILNWPHPDKLAVPRGYKIAVCAMLTMLCALAMGRIGVR